MNDHPETKPDLPDESAPNVRADVDVWLAGLLRMGTVLAALVLAVTGAWYLYQHGRDAPHYETFRGEPAALTSIAGIVQSARQGESQSLMMVGLLLLIGTPIARVVGCVFAFALERDWSYLVISLVVLLAVLFGLLTS